MKKKIALFANAWNAENLHNFIKGVEETLPKNSADIMVFLTGGTYSMNELDRETERLIFDLPDLSTFDGVIIFGPGINFPETIEKLCENCSKVDIPVVSVGIRHEGFKYLGVDNYLGMSALLYHLVMEHKVKNIKYIAGSKDNDDSNERLRALKDVSKELGVLFDSENVFYSDWQIPGAVEYCKQLCKGPEKPNAIVCANDTLAIYVTVGLESIGIKVPRDVIVTGFDHLVNSQLFYPAISTVDQHFDQLGHMASKMLFDTEGKTPNEWTSPCEFMANQSCGCRVHTNADYQRRQYASSMPQTSLEADFREGRLYVMQQKILEAYTFAELKKGLGDYFYSTEGCEGGTFFVLMDPKFNELAYKRVEDMPVNEIPESFDVIVGKYDKEPVETKTVSGSDIIPNYVADGPNRMYIFIPLYLQNYFGGYLIMNTELKAFMDETFRKFQQAYNRSFTAYKQNLELKELNSRLSELMQTDPLTQVKNRTAYENLKDELDEKLQNGEQLKFAIVECDINNLKVINDSQGHEAGDLYIKNSCRFICNHFKHSPVFRVGGDEFVVILTDEDYEQKEKLMSEFGNDMIQIAGQDVPLYENISVASGMAVFEEGKDTLVKDVLKRADDNMYENKKAMKRGNVR